MIWSNNKANQELKSLVQRCQKHEKWLENHIRRTSSDTLERQDLDEHADNITEKLDYLKSHQESIVDHLLEHPELIYEHLQQDASAQSLSPGQRPDVTKADTYVPPSTTERPVSLTANGKRRGRPPKPRIFQEPDLGSSPRAHGRRHGKKREDTSRPGAPDKTKQQDPGAPVVSHTTHRGGSMQQDSGQHHSDRGTSCYHCGAHDLADDRKHGDIVCTSCGTCAKYIEDSVHGCLPYKDLNFYDSLLQWKHCGNTYSRKNYFEQILEQLMGQQEGDIPSELYETVKSHLRDRDHKDVIGRDVRRVLQSLGASKYYSRAHLIANKISGNTNLTTLSHHHIYDLNRLFKRIQGPFERCKGSRKNLLSYHYVLWQFFMILGISENCFYLHMPKCPKRIHEKDMIWERVCRETGLPFFSYMNTIKTKRSKS